VIAPNGRVPLLVVRLGLLALLAGAGSIASAYASSRSSGFAPHPAPVTIVRAIRAAAMRPLRSHSACGFASARRELAAMIAPTTTVRLASPMKGTPSLHASGYVFPLPRAVSFADTFGAARAGVSWHHGDDLFAPRGTPVLAVAAGVVFSVGWERLGGRRLWLRDRAGNEFYYAHLSRYSRRARDGESVRAGAVLGYVGNSGDAELTPSHLHFEIHPARLLGLGYDGAVDPTRYLRSWPAATRRGCSG
jgi:murein DD-endopeptidase MepM/ murein hydrolase activator NlpD